MMKRNQEILIFAERGKLENPGKTLEGHEGTNEEIHSLMIPPVQESFLIFNCEANDLTTTSPAFSKKNKYKLVYLCINEYNASTRRVISKEEAKPRNTSQIYLITDRTTRKKV